MSTTSLLILICGLLIVAVIIIYNTLVKLRNNRESAFANIDVQLQLRHDLIPQLLATVKGYAKHESKVLEKVTSWRTVAMSARSMDEKIAAENRLSSALNGLKANMEAYPSLKASANFQRLQTEMSDIENKLAAARRSFNSATKEYNNAVQAFPTMLIAGLLGFHKAEMFGVEAGMRTAFESAPNIEF